MAQLHTHSGLAPHSHSHTDFNAAEHGHSHEILDGPGSYMGREMPLIQGRDWQDRAFTIGIGGYAFAILDHCKKKMGQECCEIGILDYHVLETVERVDGLIQLLMEVIEQSCRIGQNRLDACTLPKTSG